MLPPEREPSSELLRALERLVRVLNERKTDYALIGGLGVAVRGPIRATRDIDMILAVPQIELPGLLESVAAQGFRVDLLSALRTWRDDHLLQFASGDVGVDWIKAVLPVFGRILGRARWEDVGDARIRVADAEGLLLLKLIAFRPRDQEDMRGILAANPGAIDLDWLRQEWGSLTTADDRRSDLLEQMVREFYSRVPGDSEPSSPS
jgi:predicted nucleotidyltransferase